MGQFLLRLLLAVSVGTVAAEDAPLPLDHPGAAVSSSTNYSLVPQKKIPPKVTRVIAGNGKKAKASAAQGSKAKMAAGKKDTKRTTVGPAVRIKTEKNTSVKNNRKKKK